MFSLFKTNGHRLSPWPLEVYNRPGTAGSGWSGKKRGREANLLPRPEGSFQVIGEVHTCQPILYRFGQLEKHI
jgi:hypothetical protein